MQGESLSLLLGIVLVYTLSINSLFNIDELTVEQRNNLVN